MKLYLAGTHSHAKKIFAPNESVDIDKSKLFILESYYYIKNKKDFNNLIKTYDSFLLDSGAFTIMESKEKKEIDWDKYVEEYATFINKYDIKLFFELDIDNIIGLQEVERLRIKLETLTGKKSIPVWHKNRGKEYFIWMCQNYPYVALGGMAGAGDKNRTIYEKLFPWFIKTAHQYGAKIHGLGYTSVDKLSRFHFDSVDSTTWLYGNKVGILYKMNEKKGTIERHRKKNARMKSKEVTIHNFKEWVKFQRYAERKL